MTEQPIVQLQGLSKRYDLRPDGPWVLHDISLQVPRGQSLAVVGPSGSGKSTLLNLIGALDAPTSGSVLLEGQDLSRLSGDELAKVRNRHIGFIFQSHHLLGACTVLENVLVPTLVSRRDRKAVQEKAVALLERVGLGKLSSRRPAELSGGERQRVAVVRALINSPRLLLADEPTGSLDHASAEGLADLLAELNRRQGLTLIVVTHSPDVAGRMGRLLHLRDGNLG